MSYDYGTERLSGPRYMGPVTCCATGREADDWLGPRYPVTLKGECSYGKLKEILTWLRERTGLYAFESYDRRTFFQFSDKATAMEFALYWQEPAKA